MRTFWINNPLDYAATIASLADTTDNNAFSKANANAVENLLEVAKKQKIDVEKPLQGRCIGPLLVASPSREFYKALAKGELKRQGGAKTSFKNKAMGVFKMIWANWYKDALYEFPATSVCNESSTVLFGNLTKDEWKVLLTADAGIEALSRAHAYLEGRSDFKAGTLCFMQMPHHGGRHNVNETVLDLLLGAKVPEGDNIEGCLSFASVANKAVGYPKKAVTNAFTTRGYSCSATKGKSIFHKRGDMPNRYGCSPLMLIRFSNEVETLD